MDFFISYTGQDEAWAEWIAWELEKENFDCVIQAWDFKPGDDFIAKMRDTCSSCKKTLAVLSEAYFKSKYGAAELNAALRSSIDDGESRLVPIRVEDCRVPDFLGNRVFIDLFDMTEDAARHHLVQGVAASLATRLKPAEAVKFPVPPSFPQQTASPGSLPGIQARHVSETSPNPHLAAAQESPEVLRILFLACDAGVGLDLQSEFDQISTRMQPAITAGTVELHSRFDVSSEDFLPLLQQISPHVLHFAGNMTGDAIVLQSKSGGIRTVSASSLLGLLRAAGRDLRFVFLNACKSLECAKRLRDFVGCAIGVQDNILDSAAVSFAADFYGALSTGCSIGNAFAQAGANLSFSDLDARSPPELVWRSDLDPEKLVLLPV